MIEFNFVDKKSNPAIAFFVIDHSWGGGVERVTADLSNIFLNNGLNVTHLVSLYQSGEKSAINYPENLKIQVLSPKSRQEYERVFEDFFQKTKIDYFIFQADNMTINKVILKVAHRNKIRAIPQYHGSPYAYLKKYSDAQSNNFFKKIFAKIIYPFKKQKLKQVIALSKFGFVCVSQGSANELKEILQNKKSLIERIKVIRNPIFINQLDQLNEKKNKISFVSRLEKKHKNTFLIIKMWERIYRDYPQWSLEIFGEGTLKTEMEKYCQEKNIENIHFHGFVSNIYKYFAQTSISVSTSNCEGFSMAIAEAMANQNAIAITNSDGGISDLVIHQKTGFVSAKNNDKMLADNVAKLIRDTELRQTMARNAYLHITTLKKEDIFLQWIDLIEEVSKTGF